MINYYPQGAMPSASFANAQLQEFIYLPPDVLEVRKALPVLLVYLDYLYTAVSEDIRYTFSSQDARTTRVL